MEKRKFIALKVGRNTFRKFYLDEILFIKADGAYLNIFFDGNDKHTITVSGKTLKKLAGELQNTELLQINRSCIVNSQKCIELKDGTCPALKLINKEIIKPITMNLLKLKELFNIKD